MNNTNKPWWKSKGIWGGIIAVIATGLQAILAEFPEAPEQLHAILTFITSLGGALGIYGRATAKDKIST